MHQSARRAWYCHRPVRIIFAALSALAFVVPATIGASTTGIASNSIAPDYSLPFTHTVTAATLTPLSVAVGVEGSDGQLWVQAPQLASGWQPLGGRIVGAPAVVAAPTLLFIGTGIDQNLWMRSATAGWSPLGVRCIGGPAAVFSGGMLTVACRGADNALWYSTTPWSGTGLPAVFDAWNTLGGVLSAGPAVAPVGNTLTFFVRGSNGQIYTVTPTAFPRYTATPWNCAGQPAAALPAGTGPTTFACNAGGALWESASSGSGWTAAASLGGSITGGPGVAPTSAQLEFFAEGTDHAVWMRTPTGWTSLGGSIVGGVGAAALG